MRGCKANGSLTETVRKRGKSVTDEMQGGITLHMSRLADSLRPGDTQRIAIQRHIGRYQRWIPRQSAIDCCPMICAFGGRPQSKILQRYLDQALCQGSACCSKTTIVELESGTVRVKSWKKTMKDRRESFSQCAGEKSGWWMIGCRLSGVSPLLISISAPIHARRLAVSADRRFASSRRQGVDIAV